MNHARQGVFIIAVLVYSVRHVPYLLLWRCVFFSSLISQNFFCSDKTYLNCFHHLNFSRYFNTFFFKHFYFNWLFVLSLFHTFVISTPFTSPGNLTQFNTNVFYVSISTVSLPHLPLWEQHQHVTEDRHTSLADCGVPSHGQKLRPPAESEAPAARCSEPQLWSV